MQGIDNTFITKFIHTFSFMFETKKNDLFYNIFEHNLMHINFVQ